MTFSDGAICCGFSLGQLDFSWSSRKWNVFNYKWGPVASGWHHSDCAQLRFFRTSTHLDLQSWSDVLASQDRHGRTLPRRARKWSLIDRETIHSQQSRETSGLINDDRQFSLWAFSLWAFCTFILNTKSIEPGRRRWLRKVNLTWCLSPGHPDTLMVCWYLWYLWCDTLFKRRKKGLKENEGQQSAMYENTQSTHFKRSAARGVNCWAGIRVLSAENVCFFNLFYPYELTCVFQPLFSSVFPKMKHTFAVKLIQIHVPLSHVFDGGGKNGHC